MPVNDQQSIFCHSPSKSFILLFSVILLFFYSVILWFCYSYSCPARGFSLPLLLIPNIEQFSKGRVQNRWKASRRTGNEDFFKILLYFFAGLSVTMGWFLYYFWYFLWFSFWYWNYRNYFLAFIWFIYMKVVW